MTQTKSPQRVGVGGSKLATYLTGLAGLAAITPATQAAVVYWNPTDVTATGNNGFNFNVLTGNISPFNVSLPPANFNVRNYDGTEYLLIGSNVGQLINSSGTDRLARLSVGSTISSAATFDTGSFSNFDKNNAAGYAWNTNTDVTGFVGFRFTNAGNTHFGWAQFTYNDGTDGSITLRDFAYEDVPNRAILAGAVVSVPEPGSLALLAMGGVIAARRRRKAAA